MDGLRPTVIIGSGQNHYQNVWGNATINDLIQSIPSCCYPRCNHTFFNEGSIKGALDYDSNQGKDRLKLLKTQSKD
jgi:hypothetical protein